jgi:hypothetical protein
MYKSLLILFLLPIFMKYNDTSHKLLYKCLAHDVMRSARQFSHSYLSYRCKCIVVQSIRVRRISRVNSDWFKLMSGKLLGRVFDSAPSQFFSLLDTLKPFLIIIINQIILSDATIRVLNFQRLL